MRRRNIKSVAHWVIMSVVLLFPILMVGISSFAQPQQEINVTESYEYETNEVNSVDDLVVGNIYSMTFEEQPNTWANYFISNYVRVREINIELDYKSNYMVLNYSTDYGFIFYETEYTDQAQYTYSNMRINNHLIQYPLIFNFVFVSDYNITNNINKISASDYLGEKTIDYDITDETMREDVNEWCASFRNLAVNVWYGNLLSAIGLGITTSMMMNVIYTYPLYVLWVYILDLVVDIFLVIINFGHNALKRLGGDNE